MTERACAAPTLPTPRRRLCLAYSVVAAVLVAGQLWPGLSDVAPVLYVLMSLIAVLATLVGTRGLLPPVGRPWRLLVAAQAAFALGDAYLLLGQHLHDRPVGAVSLADPAWLVAQALVGAGLLGMLQVRGDGLDRLAGLDGAVTSVMVGLLGWVYLASPAAGSSTAAQVLAVTYPALGVLAVVLALRVLSSGGIRGTWAERLLLAGVVLNLLGVVLWSRFLLTGHGPGLLLMLMWQLSCFCMGAAGLQSRGRPPAAARFELRDGHRRAMLPLLGACAALAPAVLLVESLRGHQESQSVIAVASLAVFLLVLGRVAVMNGLLRAASAQLQTERNDQRFRRVVQASSDLIVIVAGGRIVYATPSVGHRLGHGAAALVGTPLRDIMEERDADVLQAQAAAGGGAPAPAGEAELAAGAPSPPAASSTAVLCTLRTTGGESVPVEVVCGRLDDDVLGGVVLTMRDLGDRRRLEHQLRRLAYTDPLTGTGNRILLCERLGALLTEQGAGGALLMLDLDDFKLVNDLYGHGFGDALLVETTRRLRLTAEQFEHAVVARLGGDEFALVLPGVDVKEARWVCASLLNRLRQPVAVGTATLEVGTSIGLVMIDGSRSDVDELMRDADLAMYAAKAAGKNSWSLFEPAMHQDLVQRLTLESELRAALEAGQFELHYQPLVELMGQRVVGVEALARWRHPVRGLVPPDEFIPVAERSQLIQQLGEWVLRTACRQLVQWSREFGPDVARLEVGVNVSPRQLLDPGFSRLVVRTLTETGLDPTRLVLEITESAVMDAQLSVKQLDHLRALGVHLSIDDFGTGHSSLARLGLLPVDTIKIDRSFVNGIPDVGEAPMVRAIVAMAHSLGLSVVAEGVETEQQRRYLTDLGCERGQGYLFSRPCPPRAIGRLLREAVQQAATDDRLPQVAGAVVA